VLDFPLVRAVHTSTVDAPVRPGRAALAAAGPPPAPSGGERVPLPAPAALELDVRTALRRRRSSVGRFRGGRPTTRPELAAVLAAAAAGAALPTDATGAGLPLASLHVFVNHVEGVPPGSYLHDPATGELRLVRAGSPGGFLQRNYLRASHDLEQAGAVLVPAVRTGAVLDACGDRGYRLVTALVGASCQAVHTAAAALGLACGVTLGFDGVSYVEELGLADTGEVPLLLMMIGHPGAGPADFRYEIA
jgi:nitroreductase